MQNIVLLSSTAFIFRFLPVFLIVYWIAPKKLRNAVIYFGSIVFYAAGSPIFVLLLILLTLLNYMLGVFSWQFGRAKLPEEGADPDPRNHSEGETDQEENGHLLPNAGFDEEAGQHHEPESMLKADNEDWLIDIADKIELQTKNISGETDAAEKAAPARSSYIEQRSGKWQFRSSTDPKSITSAGRSVRSEGPAAHSAAPSAASASAASAASKTPAAPVKGEMGFVWAVALDIAVLIVFKVVALKWNAELFPLGLSFYIFKMISYQADLAMGKLEKQPSFMQTAAYFTLFTQVTQGPIMRFGEGNFAEPAKFSLDKLEEGLVYVVLGLGMKTLLADRIAILWNEIGKIGYESISTGLAWLGAYSYTFELYFDFWGYSLIAAGVTVMMGFPFIENFRHPYAAVGIGDFYRRWHATLGSWFRDYIYIPLGGSREGKLKTIRNLMVVWVLTGLWHGGTLNFLIWGVVVGIMIVLEKYPLKPVLKHVPLFGRLETWILIPLSWVIFAISDLPQLWLYFTRLFPMLSGTPVGQEMSDLIRLGSLYWPYFAAALVLCVPGVFKWILKNRRHPLIVLALTALFWVSVYYSANMSGNTFMYLNF